MPVVYTSRPTIVFPFFMSSFVQTTHAVIYAFTRYATLISPLE